MERGVGGFKVRVTGVLVIVFTVVVVYVNSMGNTFHFDDFHSITENPYIRDSGNIAAYFSDPGMFSGDVGVRMYRPLLLVTFALNYYVGGYEVFGYHLVNIFLHVFNAFFVFVIALYLFGISDNRVHNAQHVSRSTLWPALLSALYFGVHTLNTHAVNYISSRSVLLVSFFYLGAFYFYIQSSVPGTGKRISSKRLSLPAGLYLLSLLFYSCSLLSKEIAVTLPVVLLFYEYLFNRRVASKGEERAKQGFISTLCSQGSTLYSLVYRHIPFWVITVGYLLIRKSLFGRAVMKLSREKLIGGMGGIETEGVRSVYINLLTQSKATFYYMKKLIVPAGLSAEHDVAVATGLGDIILPLLIIMAVVIVAVVMVRRKAVIAFGLFWFFVVLMPEAVMPLNLIINEHRAYLPGVGFVIVVGGVYQALRGEDRRRVLLSVVLVLIIMANGYATIKRNRVWTDEVTLWQDVVNKYPGIPRAHNNMGVGYQKRGENEEAIEAFKTSIGVDWKYPEAHINLGGLYAEQGLLKEAIREYKITLQLKPKFPEAHYNLGKAYAELGLTDEAEKEYRMALKQKPYYVQAMNNLGLVYASEGLLEEAIAAYKQVIKLESDYAEAYYNLGLVYFRKGIWDMAISFYNVALKYEPNNVDYINNLGNAYARKGLMARAEEAYLKALKIDPNSLLGHYNLGVTYKLQGLEDKARTEFKESLKIDPNFKAAQVMLQDNMNQ